MKNAMSYNGYTGTVEYSEEDGCLFGRIAGICDIISYEGDSVETIKNAFEEAVEDYVRHCVAIGKEPKAPLRQANAACYAGTPRQASHPGGRPQG